MKELGWIQGSVKSPAQLQPSLKAAWGTWEQGQGEWSEVKATQCIRGGTAYPPSEISRAWGAVSFTWCFPSFTKEFRENSPFHPQQPHKAKGLLLGLIAPNPPGAKKKVPGVLEVSEVEKKKENPLELSTINWHYQEHCQRLNNKGICHLPLWRLRASLVAQMVKRLPATQETWVQSLGQEDPLEKEMATTGTLAWRTPWTEETVGYSPWCRKDSDMTELSFSHPFLYRDWAPCCSSYWPSSTPEGV